MRIFPIFEIDVSPDIFIFKLTNKQLALRTMVSYEYGKRLTMKSIGEGVVGSNIVTVGLFNPTDFTTPPVEKLWLLSEFVSYGIGKLVRKKNIVFRPHVIYKGDNKLSSLLCGYQRSLLRAAAIEGGARKVDFE
ncbi:MAG: hypothetical protein ACOYZ8_04015 [Chloroflexota bacterium]